MTYRWQSVMVDCTRIDGYLLHRSLLIITYSMVRQMSTVIQKHKKKCSTDSHSKWEGTTFRFIFKLSSDLENGSWSRKLEWNRRTLFAEAMSKKMPTFLSRVQKCIKYLPWKLNTCHSPWKTSPTLQNFSKERPWNICNCEKTDFR